MPRPQRDAGPHSIYLLPCSPKPLAPWETLLSSPCLAPWGQRDVASHTANSSFLFQPVLHPRDLLLWLPSVGPERGNSISHQLPRQKKFRLSLSLSTYVGPGNVTLHHFPFIYSLLTYVYRPWEVRFSFPPLSRLRRQPQTSTMETRKVHFRGSYNIVNRSLSIR